MSIRPTIDFAAALDAYRSTVDHPEQPCKAASELVEAKQPTWILRNSHRTLAAVDAITGRVRGHEDQEADLMPLPATSQNDAAEVCRMCVQGAKLSASRR